MLSHPIFVTGDSLNNYAHVWYVSQRFWHDHAIPLRMPVLGHGEAFAFPYGFIPWFTAALLRPLLGDWVVTLWLVLGALGTVAAAFWALPELRRGYWPALLLINPPLLDALVSDQMSFLWAARNCFSAPSPAGVATGFGPPSCFAALARRPIRRSCCRLSVCPW